MEIRTPKTDNEWEAYYDLRYKLLRKPLKQPRGSEKNHGDIDGIHLALFDKNEIYAILRLDQAEQKVAQVRFVAVTEQARGKGYGKLIMDAAEKISKSRGDYKMILQAREESVNFYARMNYILVEKTHLLFDQIQHFLMQKEY